ncbi:MAG: sialidase family protein [Chthoniobacter sp.]|uniref:sialidase family protein n=1 Tax=Chthoniobacter sp. TaxID=2510640 RepID=UPI0032A7535A
MIRFPLLLLAALLLCFAACSPRACAEENQVVLNIEPTKENPRNSEGSFVRLKSGRVLFYYSQFYGGAEDGSPARIVAIHSDDAGRTWSAPQVVLENTAGNNVMSVSLLRLASGKLAFFYVLKNSWLDCRPYVRFSTDETATWSEPKLIVAAPGYFVLNNDRVVQLSTGRLVVPVAFHRSHLADPQSSKSFDPRAIAMWYYSDDEGQTWQESPSWWTIPVRSGSGLQEPGLVELADGKLFSWARTDQGAQYGFTSTDAGKNWSAPAPTEMKSPTSPASIKRLPGSASLLAVYNDHSGRFPFPIKRRTPLAVAVSSDGGQSWPNAKLIEEDPASWYCYTAIYFVDDAVLLAYCAGDAKVGPLNRLRIRRISLDWLPAR